MLSSVALILLACSSASSPPADPPPVVAVPPPPAAEPTADAASPPREPAPKAWTCPLPELPACRELEGAKGDDASVARFGETVHELSCAALELEMAAIASCAELGAAVGVPEETLETSAKDGEGAKIVCSAAADAIQERLAKSPQLALSIELDEPTCYQDVAAWRSCLSACGETVGAAEVEAACEGGEVVDRSGEAACTGELVWPAANACARSCRTAAARDLDCDPGPAQVRWSGKPGPDDARLAAALEEALPGLTLIMVARGRRLGAAAAMLGASVQQLPEGSRSPAAARCLMPAVTATVDSAATISIVIEAVASVVGAVGG